MRPLTWHPSGRHYGSTLEEPWRTSSWALRMTVCNRCNASAHLALRDFPQLRRISCPISFFAWNHIIYVVDTRTRNSSTTVAHFTFPVDRSEMGGWRMGYPVGATTRKQARNGPSPGGIVCRRIHETLAGVRSSMTSVFVGSGTAARNHWDDDEVGMATLPNKAIQSLNVDYNYKDTDYC
jgi:hypothetical protein